VRPALRQETFPAEPVLHSQIVLSPHRPKRRER